MEVGGDPGRGPSPAHQSDRERCQDDPSPNPAWWEHLVTERNWVCFFPPTLLPNVGENKFWLAGLASFKSLKPASFVLCDVSFRFLPPTGTVSCFGAGLQKGFRSYVFVEKLLIYSTSSLWLF